MKVYSVFKKESSRSKFWKMMDDNDLKYKNSTLFYLMEVRMKSQDLQFVNMI